MEDPNKVVEDKTADYTIYSKEYKGQEYDKNLIAVETYYGPKYTITVYSALWCKSCVRIKESFGELFKDYHKKIEEKNVYMDKNIFKKGSIQLIPFFEKSILSDGYVKNPVIQFIQSSNLEVLKKFLSEEPDVIE